MHYLSLLIFKTIASIFLFFTMHPLAVFAQDTNALPNPLDTTDPNEVGGRLIKSILGVVGVTALIMFIYGGIELLTSRGNPESVQKGRQTLMWATLGLIVILGSYGLVRAVLQIILGDSII